MRTTLDAPRILIVIVAALAATSCATTNDVMHDPQQGVHFEVVSGTWQTIAVDPGDTGAAVTAGALELPGRARPGGATFAATIVDADGKAQSTRVRIGRSQPHRNLYRGSRDRGGVEYEVLFEDERRALQPLCRNESGGNWALAVPGVWTIDAGAAASSPRFHYEPGGRFSFACVAQVNKLRPRWLERGAVVAKCIDWGFRPWPAPAARASGAADAIAAHEACVLLAAGDYCGHGRPHTVDGTYIRLFDIDAPEVGPTVETLPSDPHYHLEAAWAAPGPDRNGGALCLSKKRWTTLPFNYMKACGGDISRDPRVADSGGKGCDDDTTEALRSRGARLWSYSLINDAGLYRCTVGDRSVTTTRVQIRGGRLGPAVSSLAEGACEFEGTLVSAEADLSQLPNGLSARSLIALRTHGFDLAPTDTEEAPAPSEVIGYLLRPDAPSGPVDPANPSGVRRGAELVLYADAAGATITTAAAPPEGFKVVKKLGYFIELP